MRAVLGSDAYADAVRADEARARELRIDAVPFCVVDGRFGIPGAQPADVILQTLRRAWDERNRPVTVTGEGATCGPDGCGP